jgi:hypothetical protein
MLGVSNKTDFRTSVSPKFVIGQFSTATKNGKLKLFLNYIGGKSNDSAKMNQYDAVITMAVSDKFSMGYNGTIARFKNKSAGKWSQSNNWWGSALYFNFDASKSPFLVVYLVLQVAMYLPIRYRPIFAWEV